MKARPEVNPRNTTPDPRTWTTLDYAAVVMAEALKRWNEPAGTGKARLARIAAEAFPKQAPKPKPKAAPNAPRLTRTTEPAPHGTDRRYRAGCSCWHCRRAHSATQAAYRESVKRREAREAPKPADLPQAA